MKVVIALLANICQKKLQEWRIKVWCLANAKSKFVYNFDIYCDKNGMRNEKRDINGQLARRSEPKLTHNVVMTLIEGNEGRGHYIVINNFFFSIGPFEELEKTGTYALGIIRSN